MLRQAVLVWGVVAGLLSGPALAQSACTPKEEAAASQLRAVQTSLMVAALSCREASPKVLADYNSFLRSSKDVITSANTVLKKRFIRLHGPTAGQRAYDVYTTSMANKAGRIDDMASFCESMTLVMDEVAQVSPKDLTGFIARYPSLSTVNQINGPICD
jgi:hypothetical protein